MAIHRTRWIWALLLIAWLWLPLQAVAASACLSSRFNDWTDLGCSRRPGAMGNGGLMPGGSDSPCGGCQGMPRWWVSEPNLNLFVADEPLSYMTSYGERFTFRWTYKQRAKEPDVFSFTHSGYGAFNFDRKGSYYRDMRSLGMTDATWQHQYLSDIVFWDYGWEQNHIGAKFQDMYEAFLYLPGGGIAYYTNWYPNYQASIGMGGAQVEVMTPCGYPVVPSSITPDTNGLYWGSLTNGFRVKYPDGSRDIYGLVSSHSYAGSSNSTARAFMTQRIDRQGRTTRLGYEVGGATNGSYISFAIRPRYVIDPDGRTNTIRYASDNCWHVSEIEDPHGRKMYVQYDNNRLSGFQDAAQLASTFAYTPGPSVTNWQINFRTGLPYGPPYPAQLPYAAITEGMSSGWITNITTPYATTLFKHHQTAEDGAASGEIKERAILVTETNSHQLYYYRHLANGGLIQASEASLPVVTNCVFDSGTAGDHGELYYRNSIHWNRRQFDALPTNTKTQLTQNLFNGLSMLNASDYRKGRLRHWLRSSATGTDVADIMSSEREPSPDSAGSIEGQRTWFWYDTMIAGNPCVLNGNDITGMVAARLLPGNETRYIREHYFPSDEPTTPGFLYQREETYSLPGGGVGLRTNFLGYNNTSDPIRFDGPGGCRAGVAWTANHLPSFITNANKEVTSFSFSSDGNVPKLWSLSLPSGLSASMDYYHPTNPASFSRFLKRVVWSNGQTNHYTWSNSLVATVSNQAGLKLGFKWDGLLRMTNVAFPDSTTIEHAYDALNLSMSKDRLGHPTTYGHNAFGQITAVTNPLQAVASLDWCSCGSLDSITVAQTNVTSYSHNNQGRMTGTVYPDGSQVFYHYDTAGRLTNIVDGTGRWIKLAYNNQGLVTSIRNPYGTVASAVYDERDRPLRVTDALGVTVTNEFDAMDRVIRRAWPGGSEGFGWSTNGLVAHTNTLGKVTRMVRDAAGQLLWITNANLEVTGFTYDPDGNLKTLTQVVDGTARTTTWNYDVYGRVTNKVDALNQVVGRWSYDANGNVTNVWTPMFGDTAYTYDDLDNPRTAGGQITFNHDSLGRLQTMVDPLGTHAFGWNAGGRMASEDGPWANDVVSYGYDSGHRNAMSINSQPSTLNFSYYYDNAWRMQTLGSPAGTFEYNHGSASSQIMGIALPNGASITNHFDALGRLDGTALLNQWGQVLDGSAYVHDPTGLRTNITRNLGITTTAIEAGYDDIGQLTRWKAREPGGAARLNEQYGWTYDAAGNLLRRTNNGLVVAFGLNAANQITNSTRSGTLTVSGATPTPASSVTINGQTAQRYADFTWASSSGFTLNNGSNSFTVIAQNAAGRSVTNKLNVNLPINVVLKWDANGNLTNDGMRSFRYDSFNQLTNITVAGLWKSDFVYDGLGRKRVARDFKWQSNAWVKTNEVRYVFDGGLVVQERDANNTTLVTYTRGLDISGSLQGAGGIGGLLARSSTLNNQLSTVFYHSDGAGNVTALLNDQQNIVARYAYNPFGELVGKWGLMADANPYRFSSKPVHRASGLYDYGFRWYSPNLQRWTSQDPIGEMGGGNLYGFVWNSPQNAVDDWGMAGSSTTASRTGPVNVGANWTYQREFEREVRSFETREARQSFRNTVFQMGLETEREWQQLTPEQRAGYFRWSRANTPPPGQTWLVEPWKPSISPSQTSSSQNCPNTSQVSQNAPPNITIEGAAKGTTALARSPWPGNSGFIEGTVERRFLMPGETFDRYGFGGGKFVSPAGTPYEARALRAGTENLPFNTYQVVKPFEVNAGGVQPWFGQPGLGTQYELPISVNTLLNRGIIKPAP